MDRKKRFYKFFYADIQLLFSLPTALAMDNTEYEPKNSYYMSEDTKNGYNEIREEVEFLHEILSRQDTGVDSLYIKFVDNVIKYIINAVEGECDALYQNIEQSYLNIKILL